MCGIAGVVSDRPIDESALAALGGALAHRGPDDQGVWRRDPAEHSKGPYIGLVHRRLSILDLAHGHQPMVSGNGKAVIVYNGEIYNSPELRADLNEHGVPLQTTCDTEVILELIARQGLEPTLAKLRGMFAFACWDESSRKLLIARDHLGQKPLFYVKRPGFFAFASEIKALLAAGIAEHEVDIESLWHHTGLRFCPDDSSLIAGVRKLRPAEAGAYQPDTDELKLERYWTLDYSQKTSASIEDVIDELDELLDESVTAHLLSDVPTGAFLSGGIDSSTIAAYAVKHAGKGFPTFTVGVGDERFSELAPAKLAAETIGSEHHELRTDPDLFRLLPRIVWHLEEPGDPHAVGVFLLSGAARERVKVALGGDGGDEAFGGYTRFTRSRALDTYSLLPRFVRERITGPMIDALPTRRGYYSLKGQARWAHEMSMVTGSARQTLALTYFRFPDSERRKLFGEGSIGSINNPDTGRFIAEFHDFGSARDESDRLMYTEQMTRMAEHDLRVADRMSMAHGLELRAPIMDRTVMAYAATLPSEYKIKPGKLKIVLRELNRRFYPPEFTDRKKFGFGFPMAAWFAGELAPFVRNVIEEGEVFESGLIRRDRALEIAQNHADSRADHAFQIWNLINLEIWYQLFILARSVSEVTQWIGQRLETSARSTSGK